MSAYIYTYMHEFIPSYMFLCIHILTHTYLPLYIHKCTHSYRLYTDIHTYMCCGNKYVPYYSRVLIFWWGNPSLLNYDDVITLHC